jgi:hypothetical protein
MLSSYNGFTVRRKAPGLITSILPGPSARRQILLDGTSQFFEAEFAMELKIASMERMRTEQWETVINTAKKRYSQKINIFMKNY